LAARVNIYKKFAKHKGEVWSIDQVPLTGLILFPIGDSPRLIELHLRYKHLVTLVNPAIHAFDSVFTFPPVPQAQQVIPQNNQVLILQPRLTTTQPAVQVPQLMSSAPIVSMD
jgi:hypothetical protein